MKDQDIFNILFGKTSFNAEVDDSEKFFMSNAGQTCKLTKLTHCRIEGKTVVYSFENSVESSFAHI